MGEKWLSKGEQIERRLGGVNHPQSSQCEYLWDSIFVSLKPCWYREASIYQLTQYKFIHFWLPEKCPEQVFKNPEHHPERTAEYESIHLFVY